MPRGETSDIANVSNSSPNVYARSGILTHVISTLPTIAVEHFPSFWQEIRSPNRNAR
jgi:hypothetical protein